MQIDLSQFHDIFRGEAEMLLERIDLSLGLLESGNPAQALIETVFRSAHTLKGAAAALELGEIRDLAQALEHAFAARKGGSVGEALLQAAAAATLLVREMLRVLDLTSDSLRAAASRAREHLIALEAPSAQEWTLDAGAQQAGAIKTSVCFQEARR